MLTYKVEISDSNKTEAAKLLFNAPYRHYAPKSYTALLRILNRHQVFTLCNLTEGHPRRGHFSAARKRSKASFETFSNIFCIDIEITKPIEKWVDGVFPTMESVEEWVLQRFNSAIMGKSWSQITKGHRGSVRAHVYVMLDEAIDITLFARYLRSVADPEDFVVGLSTNGSEQKRMRTHDEAIYEPNRILFERSEGAERHVIGDGRLVKARRITEVDELSPVWIPLFTDREKRRLRKRFIRRRARAEGITPEEYEKRMEKIESVKTIPGDFLLYKEDGVAVRADEVKPGERLWSMDGSTPGAIGVYKDGWLVDFAHGDNKGYRVVTVEEEEEEEEGEEVILRDLWISPNTSMLEKVKGRKEDPIAYLTPKVTEAVGAGYCVVVLVKSEADGVWAESRLQDRGFNARMYKSELIPDRGRIHQINEKEGAGYDLEGRDAVILTAHKYKSMHISERSKVLPVIYDRALYTVALGITPREMGVVASSMSIDTLYHMSVWCPEDIDIRPLRELYSSMMSIIPYNWQRNPGAENIEELREKFEARIDKVDVPRYEDHDGFQFEKEEAPTLDDVVMQAFGVAMARVQHLHNGTLYGLHDISYGSKIECFCPKYKRKYREEVVEEVPKDIDLILTRKSKNREGGAVTWLNGAGLPCGKKILKLYDFSDTVDERIREGESILYRKNLHTVTRFYNMLTRDAQVVYTLKKQRNTRERVAFLRQIYENHGDVTWKMVKNSQIFPSSAAFRMFKKRYEEAIKYKDVL